MKIMSIQSVEVKFFTFKFPLISLLQNFYRAFVKKARKSPCNNYYCIYRCYILGTTKCVMSTWTYYPKSFHTRLSIQYMKRNVANCCLLRSSIQLLFPRRGTRLPGGWAYSKTGVAKCEARNVIARRPASTNTRPWAVRSRPVSYGATPLNTNTQLLRTLCRIKLHLIIRRPTRTRLMDSKCNLHLHIQIQG